MGNPRKAQTRAVCLSLVLGLICLSASGCAVTGEVENQAYALVMGVDGDADGGIELTIRIPRIGQGKGGDEASGGRGEPYLVLSAAGDNYPQAMEHLQWAVARELNLSQLKLLVVSEALASDAGFGELIRAIAETRHLYTTAAFIVCEGRARTFVEGQETLLGAHLSGDIEAMFRHYYAHGFIPSATFADLYYATLSCYSDPVGIWGFPDAGEQPAAALIASDEDALNARTTTASARQYLGAALFRDGRMIGRLDGPETLGLNLLTRRVNDFGFAVDGQSWNLSSLRGPRVRVDVDGPRPAIKVDVWLTCAEQRDLDRLRVGLSESLEGLIRRCQALGAEPFGFAERAARHFATLGAWQAYGWRDEFPEADIAVEVHVAGPG